MIGRNGRMLRALLITLALGSAAHAAEPREIAKALSTERLGLASGEATIAMELRDRAGRVLTRTLRARIASSGTTRKMRLTFQAPADQRGVELLVLSTGGAPVQYLWLPRSSELRRIASSDRGGSFQGSDFAFSDFEDRDLSKAAVTLVGEVTIGDLPAYHITITPQGDASAPWSKVSAWIAKDALVPLKVEFERDGKVVRRLEVKRLQPIDGRLMPTRLVMNDLSKGTRTTLDISGLAPAAKFPDAVFMPESLGR